METITRILVKEDLITKNPAINLDVVNEAERARRELESLGVWKDSGSRVRNPFEIKPDPRPHGKKLARLMAQRE